MEVLPESVSMALRCLIEHRPSDSNDANEAAGGAACDGKDSTFRFAIVPGNVTAADLLRFVLQHLDLKANPADCCAQVLLPHWRCLALSEICDQPESTSAFSLLAQISNIAVLRIILPAVQESDVLPSSVMRNLLKSLIPQHACSVATQVSWFRQAGCPLSDALIADFLSSPDDFEFAYKARRDFSDWHSRVCLQYLEQVSRGCQQQQQQQQQVHLAATSAGIFALISPHQLLPAQAVGSAPVSSRGSLILGEDQSVHGDEADEAEAGDGAGAEADVGEERRERGVSALGRLTERFRSNSSRQRLKAVRPVARPIIVTLQGDSADFGVTGVSQSNNNNDTPVSYNSSDMGCVDSSALIPPGSDDLLMAASMAGDKRRRTRIFIDPATEIPQLEVWFNQESHPTSAQFAQYAEALNQMPFRQKQPPLEAKNVQLWFKNHRAKVKRGRLDLPPLAPAASGSSPPSSSAEDSMAPDAANAQSVYPSHTEIVTDIADTEDDVDLKLAMPEADSEDADEVDAGVGGGSELLGVSQLQSPV